MGEIGRTSDTACARCASDFDSAYIPTGHLCPSHAAMRRPWPRMSRVSKDEINRRFDEAERLKEE